jgi:soluble lytic murein transglycosylase-like protein
VIWTVLVAVVAASDPRVLAFSAHPRHAFDPLIAQAAVQHGLDPFVLRALLVVESRLDPVARNRRSGALGLAQLTPGGRAAVARLRAARGLPGRFTAADALDPCQAVFAAAEVLAHQVARCGSLARGLEAYNTGACSRRAPGFVRTVLRRAGYVPHVSRPRPSS